MKKKHIIITYVAFALAVIASLLLSILYPSNGYTEFENSLKFKGGALGIASGLIIYLSIALFLVLFILLLVKKKGVFIGNAFTALCLTDLSLAYFDYKEIKNAGNNAIPVLIIGIICGVIGLFGIVFGFICAFKKYDVVSASTSKPAEENEIADVSNEQKEEEHMDENAQEETATNENTSETPVEATSEEPVSTETTEDQSKEEEPTEQTTEPVEEKKEEKVEEPVASSETPANTNKNSGKYEVFPEAGFYKYRLKANNGQILTVSNSYKTKDGALKGIETFRKNVEAGSHRIVMDKKGNAQWRIFTANDSRLVVAGETYPTADGAQKALNSVLRFYSTEKVITLDKISEKEVREWRVELPELKKSQNGKIEIFQDEDSKWLGRLVASNGEVLFLTTTYSAKTTLNNSINNIKENALNGNISIVCDKQNRYQFKVFASNGVVLVLGETYQSKDMAISSAASMRNFLNGNPKIVDLTKKAAE